MTNSCGLPQLPCSDLEQTRRFFVERAGFECRTLTDVLIVGRDSIALQFWRVATPEDAREMAQRTACVFEVRDLKAWIKEFKTHGLDFVTEQQPWGALELTFKDPDGNSIRLAQALR